MENFDLGLDSKLSESSLSPPKGRSQNILDKSVITTQPSVTTNPSVTTQPSITTNPSIKTQPSVTTQPIVSKANSPIRSVINNSNPMIEPISLPESGSVINNSVSSSDLSLEIKPELNNLIDESYKVKEGDKIVYSPDTIESVVHNRESDKFFDLEVKVETSPKPIKKISDSKIAKECKIVLSKRDAKYIISLVEEQIRNAREKYVESRNKFKGKVTTSKENIEKNIQEKKSEFESNFKIQRKNLVDVLFNEIGEVISNVDEKLPSIKTKLEEKKVDELVVKVEELTKVLDNLKTKSSTIVETFKKSFEKLKEEKEKEEKKIEEEFTEQIELSETEASSTLDELKERYFKDKYAKIPESDELNLKCLVLDDGNYKEGRVIYLSPANESPIKVDVNGDEKDVKFENVCVQSGNLSKNKNAWIDKVKE
tara:strand:- start:4883 stop:6160 length:1278 start_codon:yes stop_codon:yes gene_type:complete